MEQLKNKKALITGGSRGIGKAIAIALAAEGVDIIITGRNEASLKEAQSEISKHGTTVSYAVMDVSKPAETETVIKDILAKSGQVDILINNAGIGAFGGFLEMAPEKWAELYR